MPAFDNAYSRLVATAKIALPLIALGILSTLFLVSRTIDPSQSIPYAEIDVRELANEQRVGAPRYTGVTRDGAAITVTSDSARPEGGLSAFTATGVVADIKTAGGLGIGVVSSEGRVDTDTGLLNLRGGVTVTTSSGWTVVTEAIEAKLDQTHLATESAVSAKGPLGTLDAGRMDLSWQDAPRSGSGDTSGSEPKAGGYVLVFNGGVKLVYEPEN